MGKQKRYALCIGRRYIGFGSGGEPIREGSPLCLVTLPHAAAWASKAKARAAAREATRFGWIDKRQLPRVVFLG